MWEKNFNFNFNFIDPPLSRNQFFNELHFPACKHFRFLFHSVQFKVRSADLLAEFNMNSADLSRWKKISQEDSSATIDKCYEIAQIICFSLCWHFIPNFCFKIKVFLSLPLVGFKSFFFIFTSLLLTHSGTKRKGRNFWSQTLDRNIAIAFSLGEYRNKLKANTLSY